MESNQRTLKYRDYFKTTMRSYFLQNAFNYGNYQGTGYANILFPSLRKIYKDDEAALKESATGNIEFYNTNPQLVPFVTSMHLAMLDSKQNVDDTRGIKVALMGPLAGIGDSLSQFGIAPLFSTIAAGLAMQGLFIAPIFFLLATFLITFGIRIAMGHMGYKFGVSVIEKLNDQMAAISRVATIIGITVISGLAVSFVKVQFAIEYKTSVGDGEEQVVGLQTILDKIMPNLLPVLVTLGVFVLIRKYKWTTNRLVLLIMVVGVLLSALGIIE